jgi:hypothetical protein
LGEDAKRLVVCLLKRLKPSDKFFDGCRVISGAKAVQLQIGIDDGYGLHGSIGLKINFCRNRFDVPMRFERLLKGAVHRVPQVGDS